MVALKAPRGTVQPPLIAPESDWRPPRLSELPDWSKLKRVSLDTETRDPYLRELGSALVGRDPGYITGFSIAIEDGPKWYVPIRHEGGDNIEEGPGALEYLRDNMRRFTGQLVGMNLGYDLGWLMREGIELNREARVRDVMVAEACIYEMHQSYSLDAISKRRGFEGKSEQLLREAAAAYGVDPKLQMWMLPARYVGEYAEDDADLPLKILRRQELEIERDGLWQVFDLESDLLPVLVRMRHRGIRVNEEKLSGIESWSHREELACWAEVSRETGVKLGPDDCWSSAKLAEALEKVGVKPGVTEGGAASVDKALLSSTNHPAAKNILRARKLNKLRTTFAASVRAHMVRGRIHCTFNQMAGEDQASGGVKGARFGRLSADHVNLQQQPARDEFAAAWRAIYEPEDGALLAAPDYSQQEPRLLTHYAELLGLKGAQEAAQRYRDDPNTDNHDMMTRMIYGDDEVNSWAADKYKKFRGYCKNIFLGLCYGEGGAKLARDLGLPTRWMVRGETYGDNSYHETREEAMAQARKISGRFFEVAGEEAQSILDTFNERCPYVKKLAYVAQDQAKKNGRIITLLGRHCRFPLMPDGSFDWAHKALNRLIQGGSADQTKKALIEVDRAGHFLQLQVHDELVGSVADVAEAHRMGDIMRHCVKLNVPCKVDVEVGPSWGEMEAV